MKGEGEIKGKDGVWTKWFTRPSADMESTKHLDNLAWKQSPVKERQMMNDRDRNGC